MSVIEDYLTANVEFEEAKRQLSAIAIGLRDFGTQLGQYPENTCFSNCGVGLPPDIIMSRGTKSYDANGWETPDQIQAAIQRRFDAKRKVQSAWAAVPKDMQASLVPPKL